MPAAVQPFVKPTLAIDFDGVLHSYASYSDPIGDPIEGAVEWLYEVAVPYRIVIFTARASDTEGQLAVVTALGEWGFTGIPYTVTDRKPVAVMYVDDRGWQFDGPGTFPTVAQIAAFEPWWGKAATTAASFPTEAAALAWQAYVSEPYLTIVVRAAVEAHGGALTGFEDRLKQQPSLEAKLEDRSAAAINDAVRYTGQFDEATYTTAVEGVIADLEAQGFTLGRLRNYWLSTPDQPIDGVAGTYVGINAVFRTRDGYPFEVQFHTAASQLDRDMNWESYQSLAVLTASERADVEAKMKTTTDQVVRPPGVERLQTTGNVVAAAQPPQTEAHNQLLVRGYKRADDLVDRLAAVLEPILTQAGNKAAANFRHFATDHLTAAAPWTPPTPNELINVDSLVATIRAKTDPVRNAAVESMMTPALDGVGIAWDATEPLTAKVLAQAGSQIKGIAETTQVNVMKIISQSYKAGLSIPDTAAAIQAGMKEASLPRATLIARTEMAGAVNGGSLAAAKIINQSTGGGGGAQYKVWLTAPGAMFPRHEEYDDLDGQTVSLDAYFDVGGEQLEYPGDPAGDPSEVCNCRCTMEYTDNAPDDASGGGPGGSMDAATALAPTALSVAPAPPLSAYQDHFAGWAAGLSQAQEDTLWSYKSGDYAYINRYLRTGATEGLGGEADLRAPTLAKVKSEIKNLDAMFKKSPGLDADRTVYRGTVLGSRVLGATEPVVGETLSDPAFVSTSLSEESAVKFAGGGSEGVLYEYRLPQGWSVINPETVLGGEDEALLNRGQRFVVTDVRSERRVLPDGTQQTLWRVGVAPEGSVVPVEAAPTFAPLPMESAVQATSGEWTQAELEQPRDWVKPPPAKGTSAHKAGGYSSDTGFGTNTSMGDWAENHFSDFTGGQMLVRTAENVARQLPFDVRVDGYLFEVKACSTESTKLAATPKAAEIASKKAFAADAGLQPAIVVPVLDRDTGIISYYWRPGVQGGRVSERTGWRYMGSQHVSDWPTPADESAAAPPPPARAELTGDPHLDGLNQEVYDVTSQDRRLYRLIKAGENVEANTARRNALIKYRALINKTIKGKLTADQEEAFLSKTAEVLVSKTDAESQQLRALVTSRRAALRAQGLLNKTPGETMTERALRQAKERKAAETGTKPETLAQALSDANEYPNSYAALSRALDQSGQDYLVLDSHEMFGGGMNFPYKVKQAIVFQHEGVIVKMETISPEATFASADAAALRSYIDNAPPEMRAKLKMVSSMSGASPADAYWGKKYGIANFVCAAQGGGDGMTFWRGATWKPERDTFNHELGHVVGANGGPLHGTDWMNAQYADKKSSASFRLIQNDLYHSATVGTNGVTEYGAVNIKEDWAESVSLYLADRADGSIAIDAVTGKLYTFAEIFPARAQLLNNYFGVS